MLSRLAKFAGQLGFLSIFLLMTIVPSVQAHPDFEIVDGTIEIALGKFAEFPLAVHYHRVVGTFEVMNPADGTVNILLMDDQAFSNFAAGQPSSQLFSSGETNRGTIDLPIHCCIKARTGQSERDSDYTRYHLVIENVEASVSTTVKVKVDLVHDGAAVILYYGEPFAVVQVGGLVVVISTILSLISIRRGTALSVPGLGAGRKTLLVALGSLAILFLAAISAYGLSGALERIYGESLLASFSLPIGVVGGAYSISAILILWIFAIHLRKKGADAAIRLGSRLMGTVFLILGVNIILVGILSQLTYSWFSRTALLPSIVGFLLVLGGSYLIIRFRKRLPLRV